MSWSRFLLVMPLACAGEIGAANEGGAPGGTTGPGGLPDPSGGGGAIGMAVGKIGMRRLSVDEHDNTLRDLLGDTSRPASRLLPGDILVPFDNDFATQRPSAVLVEALETLAADVTARLLSDPARRDAVLGCQPKSIGDVDCLRRFIGPFGRRALRRPLAPGEIDGYVQLAQGAAQKAGDFYFGFAVALRAMLQDPELVYRIETGTPVAGSPGVFKLDPWQIATRLSYLLWGTTPPDALLDLAAGGKLATPTAVRSAAADLLNDARAIDRIDRFHALWLDYARLPHPAALTTAMRRETAALVKRVLTGGQSWLDLFLSNDTFIDGTLAAHYGLPAPAGGAAAWVPYGTSGRRGLLSHGTFLSAAGKFAETSPTQRGLLVRTRLFCQSIGSPPADVMADDPPKAGGSPCKWDRYEEHRQDVGCAACHAQMDPIGFGLENYDGAGRYRTHDEGLPQCPIQGDGELVGIGRFRGPAELAVLLTQNEDLYGPCVAAQMYRFAMGHREGAEDAAAVQDLQRRFRTAHYRLGDMLLEIAAMPAFGYRRSEE